MHMDLYKVDLSKLGLVARNKLAKLLSSGRDSHD